MCEFRGNHGDSLFCSFSQLTHLNTIPVFNPTAPISGLSRISIYTCPLETQLRQNHLCQQFLFIDRVLEQCLVGVKSNIKCPPDPCLCTTHLMENRPIELLALWHADTSHRFISYSWRSDPHLYHPQQDSSILSPQATLGKGLQLISNVCRTRYTLA